MLTALSTDLSAPNNGYQTITVRLGLQNLAGGDLGTFALGASAILTIAEGRTYQATLGDAGGGGSTIPVVAGMTVCDTVVGSAITPITYTAQIPQKTTPATLELAGYPPVAISGLPSSAPCPTGIPVAAAALPLSLAVSGDQPAGASSPSPTGTGTLTLTNFGRDRSQDADASYWDRYGNSVINQVWPRWAVTATLHNDSRLDSLPLPDIETYGYTRDGVVTGPFSMRDCGDQEASDLGPSQDLHFALCLPMTESYDVFHDYLAQAVVLPEQGVSAVVDIARQPASPPTTGSIKTILTAFFKAGPSLYTTYDTCGQDPQCVSFGQLRVGRPGDAGLQACADVTLEGDSEATWQFVLLEDGSSWRVVSATSDLNSLDDDCPVL